MSDTAESDMDILQERDAIAIGRRLAAVRAAVRHDSFDLGDEVRECVDCGDDIPAERLRAAPFAKRCVGCQGTAERR